MNLEEFLTNQTRDFRDTPEERKHYRRILYLEGAAAALLGIAGFGIHNPLLHGLNQGLFTLLSTEYLLRSRRGQLGKPVSGLIGLLKGGANEWRSVPKLKGKGVFKYDWGKYFGNETKEFGTTPGERKDYSNMLYKEAAASILLGTAAYFIAGPVGLLAALASTYAGLDYMVRARGDFGTQSRSGIGGLVKGYLAKRKANQSGANPSANGGSP